MTETAKRPRVSIGMPVYNGEKLVCEAIDSLLAQTFTDFELIISDNASTDSTEVICRKYAAGDSRIRYVRHSENRGAEYNFQFVLQEAKGEYFKWMAYDDYLNAQFIESIVGCLDRNRDVVSCISDVVVDSSSLGRGVVLQRIDGLREGEDWTKAIEKFILSLSPYFSTGGGFYSIYGIHRRIAAKEAYASMGFIPRVISDEYPFLLKLALRGRIVALSPALWTYRRHPNAQCETNSTYKSFLNLFFRHNLLNEIYKCFVILRSSLCLRSKGILILQLIVRQPIVVWRELRSGLRGSARILLTIICGEEKARAIRNRIAG
jgi:glycosyltransferase involved in cell wall biosynthesis